MRKVDCLVVAKDCLAVEAEAVLALQKIIDENFQAVVDCIWQNQGKLIVTGIGKAGHIARKIAATMSSTGTPAVYLHPVEAIHGDSGVITKNDIVLALSNSGETEVVELIPYLKRLAIKLVAITGRSESTLANNADLVLLSQVEKEACPLGLAPTASTTAMLALGDALAVALLAKRGFTAEQFAFLHPAGALGKQLLLTVGDIMRTGDRNPLIIAGSTVKQALFEITEKGAGAVSVVDNKGKLLGIITDGDIRRALGCGHSFLDSDVTDIMTIRPRITSESCLAAEALRIMENNKPTPITVIPVVNGEEIVIGMVHITDLARSGVV